MQICFTSYSGIRRYSCTSYTCLAFQMAPNNVPPHNRRLMGHSELLHGSIMQEKQRLITFIFVNMTEHPRILNNNIYRLSKRGPPPFFNQDTSLVLGSVLVYSFEKKNHVLVVTVELIWFFFLNIISSKLYTPLCYCSNQSF